MYVKSKDYYLFFDRDRVIAETAAAERKGLSRFGAYCRAVARNSIKNATEKKKVSKPGEPPLGHTGLLKKFIYFGWDGEAERAIHACASQSNGASKPSLWGAIAVRSDC